jgi:hypothetical protein
MSTPTPAMNPWKRPIELVALLLLPVILAHNCENPRKFRHVRRAVETHSALSDLMRAMETYAHDYGTFPSLPGKPLVADQTYFVQCLMSKGYRGHPYFHFREEDIESGAIMSAFGKPFYYTYPAQGVPGPDGIVHDNVPYYLWTWGWDFQGDRRDAPASEWGINNWSR